ncbi:MAG: S49 family peptidase [Methanobacteriota archaeon]|jgi:protease-4
MAVREALHSLSTSRIFLVLSALIIGYIIFNALVTQPKVGVITISGTIGDEERMGGITAREVASMLRYAKGERSIKAVVLEMNSPGGLASASEEIYMSALDLKKEKPLVASINGIGASGAYYAAVASNYIYAKPTSIVGSVGVVTKLPTPERLDEDTLITGPFKEMGASRRDWAYQTQMVGETFLQAVMLQRNDKLKISREELARGEVYIGTLALRYGLIDEIGSTGDAIEKAAQLAGIANYKVMDIAKEMNLTRAAMPFLVNETLLRSPTNTAPINYYIYMEFEK